LPAWSGKVQTSAQDQLIQPKKVGRIRGDVQEREVSHFYWQTMNEPDSSSLPDSFI
jgi:hypothetical protein